MNYSVKLTNQQIVTKTLFSWVTILALIITQFLPYQVAQAQPSLSIEPLTWNVVGLDSNNVNVGPNTFPVGARVCNTGTTPLTNVTSTFTWDSDDPYINLRTGSLPAYADPVTLSTTSGSNCIDYYYEIEVERDSKAYTHTRRYHISATSTETGAASTATPREIYVERLVSQSRNAVYDVKLDNVSIPDGGTLNLMVGGTYDIELVGKTATNGYNQLESFISLPNTIFRVNSVKSTYSVSSLTPPYKFLYADSCGWESNPLKPTYRSCVVSDGKSGGDVSTKYNVTIISGGGTSEVLTTLLYDFSGSSYHYNADFTTSFRIAKIQYPFTFSKAFSPTSIKANDPSSLTFTIKNLTANSIANVGFVDNLPSLPKQMKVVSPGVSPSGCGTPNVVAVANSNQITVSNVTLAGNGTCTISVNVTVPENGTYINTTEPLTLGGVSTGLTASANLTASTVKAGTGICGQTLAKWSMDPSQLGTILPPEPFIKANNVGTPLAYASAGLSQSINDKNGLAAPNSWDLYGFRDYKGLPFDPTKDEYVRFEIDTRNYWNVVMDFEVYRPKNGPKQIAVYYGNGTSLPQNPKLTQSTVEGWTAIAPLDFTNQTNTTGNTYFYIYAFDSSNGGKDAEIWLDDITFTGCTAAQKPTIEKSFATNPIAIGGTSTLKFKLINPNPSPTDLTNASFEDVFPAGMKVAAIPAAFTSCAKATFAPLAGSNTVTFSGGTIPAGSYCVAMVDVTTVSAGTFVNTSGYISSDQSGTNNGAGGTATATLTVLANPTLEKVFSPNPIYAGGTSTLTFTLRNPNASDLTGAKFDDNPLPDGMVVADPPSASSNCAGAVFAPLKGDKFLSFSSGTIPANSSCTANVKVTTAEKGDYLNTTSTLTTSIPKLVGLAAEDTLAVIEQHPGLSLSKQVGLTASGPWTNFILAAPGTMVYYRLVVENVGDVELSNVFVNDPQLDLTGCGLTTPFKLKPSDSPAECKTSVVAIPAGDFINTASVQGTFGGSTYTAVDSAETMGITLSDKPQLTLEKQVATSKAGPWSQALTGLMPEDGVFYKFILTNSGNVNLQGLSVSDPLLDTSTCEFIDPLEPGQTTVCVLDALPAELGTVTNIATAHAKTPKLDSKPSQATYTAGGFAITGYVWNDDDRNGTFDTSETGIYNAKVELYKDVDEDGIFDPVVDSYLGSQYTASDGSYTFMNLPPGSYFVQVVSGVDGLMLVSGGTNPRLVTVTEGDNTGNDFGYDRPAADLKVTKDDGVTKVDQNGSTTYTITVTNDGPDTVTGAKLIDSPVGLTISAASCKTGNTCVVDPVVAELTGTGVALPDLVKGAIYEITVTATVTATSGDVTNTATVSSPSGPKDPDTTNNEAKDTDTVTPEPAADLAVTKTNGVGAVDENGSTTYTIRVTNNGPDTVNGATLTDKLSAGLSATAASCTGGNKCTADPNLTDLTSTGVTLPDLAKGDFYEITMKATIADGTTSVTNTAKVASPSGPKDPDTLNNEAKDTDPVTPETEADLKVEKTNGVGAVDENGSTTYTIRVTNLGPDTVSGATLTDALSAGLTATAASCTAGNKCTADPNLTDLTSTGVTLPDLAKGDFYEITLKATIADGTTSVTNTAKVASPSGPKDPDTSNNEAKDIDPVTPEPEADLAVTKTNGVGAVNENGSTTYTIRVTNLGPDTVSGATLTDALSAGLSATGASCTTATDNVCATDPDLAVLTSSGVTLPDLAKGAFYEITLKATIADGATSVTNKATVASPSGPKDRDPKNNEAKDTDTVTPEAEADLTVSKTNGVGAVNENGSTTYTIRVTNNGPNTASGATLTDALSTGLTATMVSCTAGNKCKADPDLTDLTTTGVKLPDLAKGDFYEITLKASIAKGTISVSNTATVASPSGPKDPDTTNNEAADMDPVVKVFAIMGTVWNDDNRNGAIDLGETGISNAKVELYQDVDGNGAFDPVVDTYLGNQNTVDGSYTFVDLLPGSYFVKVAGGVDGLMLVSGGTNPRLVTVTEGDNTGNDFGYDRPAADLKVTKDDGVAKVDQNGSTTYTITVTNDGPDTVTGAVLKDMLGAGLTATAVSCTVGSKCTADPKLTDLTGTGVTLPELAMGESYGITLTVTVTASSGKVVNTVTVTPPTGTDDPVTKNNEATDTDDVVNVFAITGTVWKDANRNGAFDLGETGISNAKVELYKDENTNGVFDPVTDTYLGSQNTVDGSYTFVNLPPGSYFVLVADGVDGLMLVSGGDNPRMVKVTEGDNTGNDFGYDNPASDLVVTKTDGVDIVDVNSSTTYTIRVMNNGPDALTGAILKDTLGGGLENPSAVCSTAVGNQCSGTPDLSTLTSSGVTLPALAMGQFYEVELTVDVTASSGTVDNTATVTLPTGTIDPVDNNNVTDTDTVIPQQNPSADLAVTKTNHVNAVSPMGTTQYTIRVTNNGPDTVGSFVLNDVLGSGLEATAVACSTAPGNLCQTNPTLTELMDNGLRVYAMKAGEFFEILLSAKITVSSGTVSNSAEVWINDEMTQDTNEANNYATDTDPVQMYKLYLPLIMKPAETYQVSWNSIFGYEDLPQVTGQNDFDYNDWLVDVDGHFTYTSATSNLLQEVSLGFNPLARGAFYDHAFMVRIPTGTFASSGKATIKIYDQNHTLMGQQILPFQKGMENTYTIFDHTNVVFPGMHVNSVEGSAKMAPMRYAELAILFDTPTPFGAAATDTSMNSPQAQGLFFDPVLKVLNTGEEIHQGDIRLLNVFADQWLWPEEGVRIDKAYPQVVYLPGTPPSFLFPPNWWLTRNQCTVDGLVCR